MYPFQVPHAHMLRTYSVYTVANCAFINTTICDRICEKGPNPAKLTFAVRPLVAGHVELRRLSDFSQILSSMSYLTRGQVRQRGEGHKRSYDSEKLVGQPMASYRWLH